MQSGSGGAPEYYARSQGVKSMFVVHSYALAVLLCVVTMLCWGSWANTRKLTSKDWRFELFYWDYSIGVCCSHSFLA